MAAAVETAAVLRAPSEADSLEDLAAKFGDDSSDGEDAQVAGGLAAAQASQDSAPKEGVESAADSADALGGAEEDWSEDSDEGLAYELRLADLEEDMELRGGAVGSDWSGYRPNAQGNGQGVSGASKKMQPKSHELSKLDKKVNTGRMLGDALDPGIRLPSSIANSVKANDRKQSGGRGRIVDKADRATVEQALDPRTRLILFKMLNRGIFSEINGCVSTGKEANVYHGSNAQGQDMAIKVPGIPTAHPQPHVSLLSQFPFSHMSALLCTHYSSNMLC